MAFRSSTRIRVVTPASLECFARLRGFLATRSQSFRRTLGFADFYETRGAVEAERLGRLWSVVEALQLADDDVAASEAEAIVRTMPDDSDPHGTLAVRTFAEAFLARTQRKSAGGGNLYLSARPPGAQHRAFELLRAKTPLIGFGYTAANRALLDGLAEKAPVDLTLLDIGIGRGAQVRALVEAAAGRGLLRSLHVIGVEPDSSAETASGALEIAEETVLEAAAHARIPVTFHGVPKLAEEISADEIRPPTQPNGVFLATCAFALHHVASYGDHALTGRDAVLRTLHAAGVQKVVLVEPDTNHFDNDLGIRFLFAYRHYRTLASVLEDLLSPGEASVVWSEFFAPEVHNVIAHDGLRRVERHEELARWAERLVAAGFRVDSLAHLLPHSPAPASFGVRVDAAGARLGYRGVSLLGVTRASRSENRDRRA